MKKTGSLFLLFLLFSFILYPAEKNPYSLSEIIDLGLKNNPSLSAQFQEVEAKKSAHRASKALTNPRFEYQKGKASSYDQTIHRNTQGFIIHQELENPFKKYYWARLHKNDREAAQSHLHHLKLEIIYEIKKSFYKILLLKKKRDLTQKKLESIRQTFRLIKKRAELGEVKELESIKLYVETLKTEKELDQIRTDLELTKEKLNNQAGNSLPSDFRLEGELSYTPFHPSEESLLQKALSSHPLLREKEQKMKRAQSRIHYLQWQRFPDFNLSGFVKEQLHGRNKGLGISVDIPLWNFKSSEIEEAKRYLRKHKKEMEALKLDLITDVKSKLKHLRLSAQTIELFHKGLLKQAKESLTIAEVSYKHGEISLMDYLDSQRTHYEILDDYQDSIYAWNKNKAALEKVVGGSL